MIATMDAHSNLVMVTRGTALEPCTKAARVVGGPRDAADPIVHRIGTVGSPAGRHVFARHFDTGLNGLCRIARELARRGR
jgi:hypothetical protein